MSRKKTEYPCVRECDKMHGSFMIQDKQVHWATEFKYKTMVG